MNSRFKRHKSKFLNLRLAPHVVDVSIPVEDPDDPGDPGGEPEVPADPLYEVDVTLTSLKGSGARQVPIVIPLTDGAGENLNNISAYYYPGGVETEIPRFVKYVGGTRKNGNHYAIHVEVGTSIGGFLTREKVRIKLDTPNTLPALSEEGYKKGSNKLYTMRPDPNNPTRLYMDQFIYLPYNSEIPYSCPAQPLSFPSLVPVVLNRPDVNPDASKTNLALAHFALYSDPATGTCTLHHISTSIATSSNSFATNFNANTALGQILGTFAIGIDQNHPNATFTFGAENVTASSTLKWVRHRLHYNNVPDIFGTIDSAEYKCRTAIDWIGTPLVPLSVENSLGSPYAAWNSELIFRERQKYGQQGSQWVFNVNKIYDAGLHYFINYAQIDDGYGWWMKGFAASEYYYVMPMERGFFRPSTQDAVDVPFISPQEPDALANILATHFFATGDTRYIAATGRLASGYSKWLWRNPGQEAVHPYNMYSQRAWSKYCMGLKWCIVLGIETGQHGIATQHGNIVGGIDYLLDFFDTIENYPLGPNVNLNGEHPDGTGRGRLPSDDYCYGFAGFGATLISDELYEIDDRLTYAQSARLVDWAEKISDRNQTIMYDPSRRWYWYVDLATWPIDGPSDPPSTNAPNGVYFEAGQPCNAWEDLPSQHINGMYMRELQHRWKRSSGVTKDNWADHIHEVYQGMQDSDMNSVGVYGQNAYGGKAGAYVRALHTGAYTP